MAISRGSGESGSRYARAMVRSARLLALVLLSACTAHVSDTPAVERAAPAADPVPTPVVSLPEKPPTTTTWTSRAIAPGCAVEVADAPAALGPPVQWRACAGDIPGCLEATTGEHAGAIAGVVRDGAVTIAATTFLPGSRLRHVLAPRDGLPFAAVEGPRDESCQLAGVTLTEDGGAIEVTFDHADGYASRAYLRGPLAADPAWSTIAAVLPRAQFPDFIGESVFSAGGRVVVEQNGGPLRWYDGAGWIEVPGSRGGWACCAEGHGDVITFLLSGIPEQAKVARLGEPARPLLREALDGVSEVALAGRRAAWVRGFGRDRNNIYERVELWTGTLSERLEIEGAARVAALPHRTMVSPRIGGDVVVVPAEDRGAALLVYRVGGAGSSTFKAPAGGRIERVLWIGGDELAVQVGPGERSAAPSRARRYALGSLAR